MDSPSGKKLVAILAAVGASTGAAAAVVWHVAVVDPQDLGVTYARPSWFPVSLYLVAAGLAAGLVVASFLVDAGLRIVQDRRRSRVHLFVVLIVVGVALDHAVGESSLTQHLAVFNTKTRRVVADGQADIVFIDYKSGKRCAVPPALLAKARAMQETAKATGRPVTG